MPNPINQSNLAINFAYNAIGNAAPPGWFANLANSISGYLNNGRVQLLPVTNPGYGYPLPAVEFGVYADLGGGVAAWNGIGVLTYPNVNYNKILSTINFLYSITESQWTQAQLEGSFVDLGSGTLPNSAGNLYGGSGTNTTAPAPVAGTWGLLDLVPGANIFGIDLSGFALPRWLWIGLTAGGSYYALTKDKPVKKLLGGAVALYGLQQTVKPKQP